LLAGMFLGAAMFFVDWNGIYKGDFMLIAFLLLIACVLVMVVATFLFPEPLKEEARALIWDDWREPLRSQPQGHGLGNYRLASAAVLATFAVLYLIFR
jgi:hypothetical protein